MTTLGQLLYGIRQVESDGDYSVVNPIGAVGAYQVMKANIPGWTKAALGYSMNWEQFRDSRAAQDKVAAYKLGIFYREYGAEGAASMWFSGQPNPNSSASDGGNTVRQYVNKVLNASTGGNVGSSSSSSGSGSGAVTGSELLTPAETAESYGFVTGLLNSNPELKSLFGKAISGQWTPQKFQASLRDTKWFKTHGQSERDFLVLQYGDPATANQKLSQAGLQVRQLSSQLGLSYNKGLDKIFQTAAYNMAAKGWNDQQIRYYLGQYLQFPKGAAGGEAGDDLDQLHQYSYSMGIKNSDAWYQNAVKYSVRGTSTLENYKTQIRKQAEAMFPTWSKQLEAGQTVADLASPYMQSMSSILEIAPGSVNLFDPTIKKALQYKDPSSGQTTAQPIWSFENQLRQDPRWGKTKNAQDSTMQVAHQVLQGFGFAY